MLSTTTIDNKVIFSYHSAARLVQKQTKMSSHYNPKAKKLKIDKDDNLLNLLPPTNTNADAICLPINTIGEVLKYKDAPVSPKKSFSFIKNSFVVRNNYGECHQELNSMALKQRIDKHTTPKTLVCHDMKGGYLEDKYVNGCDIGNGYTFYRWSDIDIFIYFSHHFVTIPPPGWIKIAHKNNVKILGTLITEGNPGKILCNELFKSEEVWKDFAKSLVNICVMNSFDGWLLNIENPIENTKPLINFVSFLTKELRKLNHEFVILWYDSVIQDGKLKWQNELNDLNKCFFDVCDGIFLNYTWNEGNLANSVLKAQQRVLDVYVGLDVFGRNCYGGGGFNSHMAAELIRRYGLSMAIFAPGWTHETLKTEIPDIFFETYCRRDNGFWLNMYPYLYTHPITRPFITTFYLGSDKLSYNLNNQEIVLSRPTHCGNTSVFKNQMIEKCDCLQIYGEGCKPHTISYLITTCNLDSTKEYVHNLFTCNIDATRNFAVSVVTKNGYGYVDIIVLTRDAVGRRYSYRLLARNSKQNFDNNIFGVISLLDADPLMPVIRKNTNFGDISNTWNIRNYIVAVPVHVKLMEIGAIVLEQSVLFGGFAVQTDLNMNM